MLVAKEFTFDSAHFLTNYHGECENLHGHTYRMQVFVKGPLGKDGMVMDFARIKDVVQRKVLSKVDHKNLNDVLGQSSVENLCVWAWEQLKPELPLLAKIKIWETPTSFAIYDGT
ncbi:MAG: 6-carboxytetrahydropterin synthase QueD [Candidatus Peregrinibacteria bacterium]